MESVVIIGGGFGGIAAAHALGEDPVDVTIVDQRNFHTFLPLLYQVATASLNPADVAHPIRGIVRGHRNVAVHHGTVTGADWADRTVQVRHIDGTVRPLAFDHLVVATGASPNFYGVPGAAEHSFPLYSLDDATDLRNHLLARFEAADAAPSIIDDGALTFVIVGGGPTGVEVAGALVELFHGVLRHDFATLEVSRARVMLVELAPTVLPPFSPASQWHARDALRERGVELVLGDRVVRVHPRRVELAGGRVIPTHTLIWAAGVQANPLAAALGVPTGPAGRIVVDSHLGVPGFDGVYAVGDVAAIPDGSGSALPQLAPVAMQSGRHVAAVIRAHSLGGRDPGGFVYRDRGTMATIGRRSAVAELPGGFRLSGSLAWVAWLVLHLVSLIGFRNRLSVLLNWAWNYLTWDRGPRLILGRVRGVGGYGHGTDSRGTDDPTVRDVPEG